ncbi:MAG: hypothetical protein KDB60_01875 [Propionibacteriaceae bacterium]|nr:hypothetical protein [Propionibacteriaceae bacterium]
MFDLFKDVDRYRGVPPYASEHYGIYQPLLGWKSRLTNEWIRLGAKVVDPRLKRILDSRIEPAPTRDEDLIALPLEPGSGKSPWRVVLLNDLDSELLRVLREAVQGFVDAHGGKLPVGAEWNQVIEINQLMDKDRGPLRVVNDRLRDRILLRQDLASKVRAGDPQASYEAARAEHLALMQYESQIACMLLFYAEGQAGYEPDTLAKLFGVYPAPPLDDLFTSTDPLANIDPMDRSGVLSPVGFIHLFRQYFFDLGTFLGEPVEHVWLAPGTTIELIEVNTRRTLIERTEEASLESTSRSERSTAVKDELSDAIRAENDSSTKLGVTVTNSVNFGVYQGSATANLGVENARKDARESAHKQNREQAEKLSTEIKRSYKSVFRTVTETTDTRTKRYVLENPGPDLVNYELRRKMRRVGVQLQDLGTQLCWQVFVDDPGSTLGLAELVHFAESPDLANIKQPDPMPYPAPVTTKFTAPIQFTGENTDDNAGALYEWRGQHPDGRHYGNRMNTDDEDEQDKRVIMGPFTFHAQPPQADYVLAEVRPIGPQAGQIGIVRDWPMHRDAAGNPDGSFDLVMQQLQFNGQKQVPFDVELVFNPTKDAIDAYKALKKKADDDYDAEVFRAVKKTYMDSVRDRIKAAHGIASRPAWDLREEERTVVYRNLLRRLMLDSWGSPDDENQRRLNHVRSEIVRAIFDVDAMLYFVAPEWWMPRRHRTSHTFNPSVPAKDQTVNLNDENQVRWKDVPVRPDNYSITEESDPARLGSSLGWLIQLDGDNLRNAFLNAPWVKAVIPIRTGRERAALNWLRTVEGHEGDGWTENFKPSTPEDQQLVAEVQADGNQPTLGNVLEKIAEKLEAQNSDMAPTLKADKVFEHGFDPLANGFDAGLPANEIFSQWVSVLPTDQIVAVTYEPTNLLEP